MMIKFHNYRYYTDEGTEMQLSLTAKQIGLKWHIACSEGQGENLQQLHQLLHSRKYIYFPTRFSRLCFIVSNNKWYNCKYVIGACFIECWNFHLKLTKLSSSWCREFNARGFGRAGLISILEKLNSVAAVSVTNI